MWKTTAINKPIAASALAFLLLILVPVSECLARESGNQPKELKATADKLSNGSAAKSSTKKKRRKAKKSGRLTLVPPPPPTAPTMIPPAFSATGIGVPLEYMSLDDLKFKLKNLKIELAGARQDYQDQVAITGEKKNRSVKFDALYEEGVVSRKELKSSKKEARRAERDLERAGIRVMELERVIPRIEKRIETMSKQATSKKSKKSRKKRKRKSGKN